MPGAPHNPYPDLAVVALAAEGGGQTYTIHETDCHHANTATAMRADNLLDPGVSGQSLTQFGADNKVCGTCKPNLSGRSAEPAQVSARNQEAAVGGPTPKTAAEASKAAKPAAKPRKRAAAKRTTAKGDA